MAKVKIEGNASGTGTFTIAAPNSNTDRTLTLPDEAGTVLTSAGVPSNVMPSGSILQVIQTAKTDTASYGSAVHTILTLDITPISTSSKILLRTHLNWGWASHNWEWHFWFDRDGTAVGIGDAASNRPRATFAFPAITDTHGIMLIVAEYLDSPNTTNTITYAIKFRGWTNTAYINRSSTDTDNAAYDPRLISTLTAMEVAG